MNVDYIMEIVEKLGDLEYEMFRGQGHLSKFGKGSPSILDTSSALRRVKQLT